jgi:hypothetical protein
MIMATVIAELIAGRAAGNAAAGRRGICRRVDAISAGTEKHRE